MRVIFIKKHNLINAAILFVIGIVALFAGIAGSSAVSANAPIYSGKTETNSVALMFNVYGGNEYLSEIIEVLESNNVKATFFVGGVWVLKNTPEFLQLHKSGNEIGNHGYFHKDHKKIGEAQNREEILLTHDLVKKLCGLEMTLFAPPSGSYSKTTTKVASELNYATIMWTRDTIDWRDQDENLIFTRATSKTKAGDLILMHPTKSTAKALDRIIKNLKENGLNITVVSELI